jgi:hypothetical protein
MGLTIYADESGTHDETGLHLGAEVATVGGFLARAEHWERFTEKWVEVLDRYQVPAFHMTEFVDERRGPEKAGWPYKGWSQDKRDRFISALIEVARDNTIIGICGAVAVKDYDEVVPDWLKNETRHPYHFSLQNFFDNVLTALHETLPLLLLPWEHIAFSFEQQEEFEKKARELFHLIKKRDIDSRMGSIAFVPKGKFRAHEAADLFVYRMRKAITRILAGKKPFAAKSWDEQLTARNSLVVGYFLRSNLEAIVAEVVRNRNS